MSGLTDAVVITDSLKHFRESYNATRGELNTFINSTAFKSQSVREDFRFPPTLVTGNAFQAIGKARSFQWSAVDGSDNAPSNVDSGFAITNPTGSTPSHPTNSNVLRFGINSSGGGNFLYKARSQFVFGAAQGELESMIAYARYALSGPFSTAGTYMVFGLYEGNNILDSYFSPGPTNRSILFVCDLDSGPLPNVNAVKNGIGLPGSVFLASIDVTAYSDFALSYTPGKMVMNVNGNDFLYVINPAQFDGIVFNLGFAVVNSADMGSTTHFLDEIGYDLTVN